ncbi:hypothetical protein [Daeguia caeni]|uniref:hypothetical protein n=1 Tax=Daeguia caeni TaxID=439612 RepID=UPI0035BC3DB7
MQLIAKTGKIKPAHQIFNIECSNRKHCSNVAANDPLGKQFMPGIIILNMNMLAPKPLRQAKYARFKSREYENQGIAHDRTWTMPEFRQCACPSGSHHGWMATFSTPSR